MKEVIFQMSQRKQKVIPSRLAHMRQLTNKTQKELSEALGEIIYSSTGSTTTPSSVTISQWELGTKPVPEKYVDYLCKLLGCTREYLYGFTSDPYSSEIQNDFAPLQKEVNPISISNLYKYDKCPVYIVFNLMQFPNGWALLNHSADRLVMVDSIIKLSSINLSEVTIYPAKPAYVPNVRPNGAKKLDLIKTLKSEYVYIVMNSPDKTIRSMYDGLYHHNEKHTCLINAEGLTLPYVAFINATILSSSTQ